jgi:hypothetical protein
VSFYILARVLYLYISSYQNLRLICELDNIPPKKKSKISLKKQEEASLSVDRPLGSNVKLNGSTMDVALDGISYNLPPNKRVAAVTINFVFRLQLLLIPLIIVVGQNMKTPTCIVLLLIQAGVITHYLKLRCRLKKKVFSGVLSFLSLAILNSILTIIPLLGLNLVEWHTSEYAKDHGLTLNSKKVGDGLTFTIIALIGASILIEFIKGIKSIIKRKQEGRVYFKKSAESQSNKIVSIQNASRKSSSFENSSLNFDNQPRDFTAT